MTRRACIRRLRVLVLLCLSSRNASRRFPLRRSKPKPPPGRSHHSLRGQRARVVLLPGHEALDRLQVLTLRLVVDIYAMRHGGFGGGRTTSQQVLAVPCSLADEESTPAITARLLGIPTTFFSTRRFDHAGFALAFFQQNKLSR